LRQLKGHRGPVNAVAVRNNQIVSASGDALVKLWDIETGECLKEFKGHHRGLACVQFSEDAKTIVSGGNDQDIRIWDAKTGECLRTLSGHKDLVRTLHLDCLNRRIISGSYDATVKVWHLDTGKKLLDITQYHSTWILAAKADYKRIVSTSQDSRTLVLDFSAKIKGIEVLEQ
jgi:F-box and WD-40 domain protein 1/11